jgi:hypothetical protein
MPIFSLNKGYLWFADKDIDFFIKQPPAKEAAPVKINISFQI